MKISFIGDIMLARYVGSKYKKKPYQIVSKEVLEKLIDSEFIIANLESPVTTNADSEGHHLAFKAHPDILKEFGFVNCFSLSNNRFSFSNSSFSANNLLFANINFFFRSSNIFLLFSNSSCFIIILL